MEKKKTSIPSVNDLEALTTHELADLLANVVLLLRRLPDVPLSDVTQAPGSSNGTIKDPGALAAKMRREPKRTAAPEVPDWLEE